MSNKFIRVKFPPQKDNKVDFWSVSASLKQMSRLTLETSARFFLFVFNFSCVGYLTLTEEL